MNKKHEYKMEVVLNEPNFDTACKRALSQALIHFRIDDNGHSDQYDFVRSEDSIQVEFISYTGVASMVGGEHVYVFSGYIAKG